MSKIRGLRDGKNKRNEHYKIPGKGVVGRTDAIKMFNNGDLDKFGITKIKINNRFYLKDIPDNSKKDNVNS